jgi:hypothetical protein
MSKLTGIRRADLFKDHGSGVPVTGEKHQRHGARSSFSVDHVVAADRLRVLFDGARLGFLGFATGSQ